MVIYVFLKEEKKWGGRTRFWTVLSSHVLGMKYNTYEIIGKQFSQQEDTFQSRHLLNKNGVPFTVPMDIFLLSLVILLKASAGGPLKGVYVGKKLSQSGCGLRAGCRKLNEGWWSHARI